MSDDSTCECYVVLGMCFPSIIDQQAAKNQSFAERGQDFKNEYYYLINTWLLLACMRGASSNDVGPVGWWYPYCHHFRLKLNLVMKSPRNAHILFGNQKKLHLFCFEMTSKMVQASCVLFIFRKTETVITQSLVSMTSLNLFIALKNENVNNNNFKYFGYQTKCQYFAVFPYLNSTLLWTNLSLSLFKCVACVMRFRY